MNLLNALSWRYATKQFEATHKVSQEELNKIQDAIRLSASSYGLQLYKVFIIEDADLRQKLSPAAFNQPQITQASHLFIFCNYTHLPEDYIDNFIQERATTQGLKVDDLQGYGDYMKKVVGSFSPDAFVNWTSKQCYIALANLLAACAEMKIDSCPMEGFDAKQFDEILGLTDKGLSTAVLATVGKRAASDKTQHLKKFRRSPEVLFEHI